MTTLATTPAGTDQDVDHGERIIAATSRVDNARAELVNVVRAAREDGWSWADVGRTLGISRLACGQESSGPPPPPL